MNLTKMIAPNSPYLIFIRWTNFLGLSLILILSLPEIIVKIFDLGLNEQLGAKGFSYLKFYIFFFFSFWIYLIFLRIESRNRKKHKIKFYEYITSNWLIFCGYTYPFIIIIILPSIPFIFNLIKQQIFSI